MIVIGSKSQIKFASVKRYFNCNEYITQYSVDSGVNEQPIGYEEIVKGAINRKNRAKDAHSLSIIKENSIYIGIESGLVFDYRYYYDIACVSIEYDGVTIEAFSDKLRLNLNSDICLDGTKTIGKILKETEQVINEKDPHMCISGKPRESYLITGIHRAWNSILEIKLKNAMPVVKFKRLDKFYDIGGILLQPYLLKYTIDFMCKLLQNEKFDYIGSLDARGFLFSSNMSINMNKGSFMIRKKGKLPNGITSDKYNKEYSGDSSDGSDELCLNVDLKDKKVVLVDDILATGGTLKESSKLVEKAGGVVVACICIVELTSLYGRKKLMSNVYSLLKIDK